MAETSFIVRMDAELLHKLDYIAKYDDRSRNAEVTRLIRMHVVEFEKEFGKITEEEYKGI